MKINACLLRSTVVAALGGLLFGFDTAVISGTTHALTETYAALAARPLGLTVASALVGTILGAMFAGIPGDRYGRRDSLRVMAVLYLVSALGCAFAWDWYSLVFFRFIGGLGIGGSSVLGPMYIAEIAPAKWRGRLVGFFQFNIVFGILLAYLSNYLIGPAWAGRRRMALEAGRFGGSGGPVLRHAVRHSAQPALAGAEAARRRKRAGARAIGEEDVGSRAAGHRRLHRCRARPRRGAVVHLEVPFSRSSWRSPSPCSTSSPASTPSCIT